MRRLKIVMLSVALGTSSWAGALSPALDAYRQMAGALEQSVSDRTQGSGQALADLDRAAAAYTTLKPSLSSPIITGYLDEALQQAHAALGHTPADLEAQVLQARSLMRKALYDQTLDELGRTPAAPTLAPQAALLASEFGLADRAARARYDAAVQAHDTGSVARQLRQAAARKVQANLDALSSAALSPQQRTAAYLALARASGWFTVVQDAPTTGGLTVAAFSQALDQLIRNDAALPGTVQTLKQEAGVFVTASVQAARQPLQRPVAAPPAAPQTGTTQGTVLPVVQTGTGQPTTAQAPTTQPAQNGAPLAAAQSPAQKQQANLDATYAALARALSAAGHGDLPGARVLLTRASQTLPGSGLNSTPGFDAVSSDLGALATRSGVRALDVQALLGELNNLESAARTQPFSLLDTASASVSRLDSTVPLWALLLLIVGVLAFYPLYLLNLAFGGRNTYWRAISAGALLLIVPVLVEGLGGVLAYLGDLLGVPLLRTLGNLSLHQGAWALPLWLLLAAASVGLSSYGFRGLCRQFGLLGASSGSSANVTRIEPAQPALDWDEEL